MKILIIEDEPTLAQSIREYLETEGSICEIASTFDEAWMKSGVYEYDCILVDITLPGGNGLDVIRQLKKQHSAAGIIIISMDTLGAAIGPALALVFLWWYPGAYRMLFLLAFIPGLLAVAATLLIQEPQNKNIPTKERPGMLAFLAYIPISRPAYRKLLYGLLFFALLNSSDLFLLLVLKEKGISDVVLIGFYIFYNLVYALSAYPIGIFADKKGKKTAFIIGLFLFALVYGGMAFVTDWWLLGVLFFLYGLYAAFTEGIAKAWISNICQPKDTATAIGTYDGLSSLVMLLSSTAAGLIWYQFGASVLFGATAILVLMLIPYFVSLRTGV